MELDFHKPTAEQMLKRISMVAAREGLQVTGLGCNLINPNPNPARACR